MVERSLECSAPATALKPPGSFRLSSVRLRLNHKVGLNGSHERIFSEFRFLAPIARSRAYLIHQIAGIAVAQRFFHLVLKRVNQAVNQPGTWNWSNLNTRDLEGAKAFYGAVFGWQAHPMDMGDFHALMLCVPGYGDFLEGQYPGLKKRHADTGAPAAFTDSIGWVNPMTGDGLPDDVPSHWSITFAVEDVDAVVDATTGRGGKVLTPASDETVPNVGGIRTAVLSDPQGAVFAVNSFVPA